MTDITQADRASCPALVATITFPSDMQVGEDRARWYVDHAIRGYWRSFALDSDPIRGMGRSSVNITTWERTHDVRAAERLAAFAHHRIAALDEAIAMFDEDIAAQAARLGIKPRVVQSPAQWTGCVRRAAIEALKGVA